MMWSHRNPAADRKINAAAFKARCLALIDEVAENGEPLIVTKRGKAKVQIVAVREKPKTLWGATKGTFKIIGDIVGPIDEDYDEDREWRNITAQFDDPPARHAHNPMDDRAGAKARKGSRRSCDAALVAGELAVPTVVFYEVGRALKRGRVEGPPNVHDWRQRVLALGVREIGLSAKIAMQAAELDDLHGDLIDRIIVATTLVEDAVLLTADRPVLEWTGRLRRHDARR
jgi:PIN domain nuclease of toxin-antitoxin system/antitoxin (DNA-binding transcriptional repressor) of toxin-antitoxin stability system